MKTVFLISKYHKLLIFFKLKNPTDYNNDITLQKSF